MLSLISNFQETTTTTMPIARPLHIKNTENKFIFSSFLYGMISKRSKYRISEYRMISRYQSFIHSFNFDIKTEFLLEEKRL
jgi:hypothetical protein